MKKLLISILAVVLLLTNLVFATDVEVQMYLLDLKAMTVNAQKIEGTFTVQNIENKIPTASFYRIEVYVGDKFADESIVNIYHYTKDKLEEIKKEVKVEDGYIEFDIEHCSEYFVTKSDLALLKKDKNSFC